MRHCVFCGRPIVRQTETTWKCGGCGLAYGQHLMTDRDLWRAFRRRALAVLTVERVTKTDEEIRPGVGVLLAAVLQRLADESGDTG